MKSQHLKHLFELNIAILFISTSGALGRFIEMPIPVIIWWRSALAVVILFIFFRYRRINLNIKSKKDIVPVLLTALLTGAHWMLYFHALKLSNVAIGMLSLFTYPVIIALLEPLFVKVKFDAVRILLAFIVIVGVFILVPEFNLENTHVKGILFGLLSAVCYALRILISKQLVRSYSGYHLIFYQILVLTIILAPVLFTMDNSGITTQFPYILILALVTTAIGHSMFIHSLKHFTATTVSILSSAQPIFGIIIAYFFLREIPSINTLFGGLLIISTVVIESVRSKKK